MVRARKGGQIERPKIKADIARTILCFTLSSAPCQWGPFVPVGFVPKAERNINGSHGARLIRYNLTTFVLESSNRTRQNITTGGAMFQEAFLCGDGARAMFSSMVKFGCPRSIVLLPLTRHSARVRAMKILLEASKPGSTACVPCSASISIRHSRRIFLGQAKPVFVKPCTQGLKVGGGYRHVVPRRG